MRERERNLEFRRIRFHVFEKDPFLMVEIPKGTTFGGLQDNAYTRLNLKEIEKLSRFLTRIETSIAIEKRKKETKKL